MDNIVDLVLGDWSNDGHGRTDVVTIKSNLNQKAIQKAYEAGVEKLRIDPSADFCAEYEDHAVPYEDWKKLANAGLTLEDLFDEGSYSFKEAKKAVENNNDFSIYHEEFVHIYLFVVKQGAPDFDYVITPNSANRINIGGYGMFS